LVIRARPDHGWSRRSSWAATRTDIDGLTLT
jgi:hypothetical protein